MSRPTNEGHPVAQAIRRALRDAGMSRKELATAIGVSQNAVSDWTLGRSQPHVHHADAVARALGRPLDEFLDVPAVSVSVTPPTPPPDAKDAKARGLVERLAAVDLTAAEGNVVEAAVELMALIAAARKHVAENETA